MSQRGHVKKIFKYKWIILSTSFLCVFSVYFYLLNNDSAYSRIPSSIDKIELPNDYEEWDACQKQEWLWKKISDTKHPVLPAHRAFGFSELVKMKRQGLAAKMNRSSDISPKGWIKYIHAVGSVAQVEWQSVGNHNFPGLFNGADCALLRLSLTYDPSKRGVAPGAALKVFRQGIPSANLSFLSSLEPQGQNYNFFKNTMSNVVPEWKNIGAIMVSKVFKTISNYPEKISLRNFFEFDKNGVKHVLSSDLPKQIFLVPNENLKFSTFPKDVRHDFEALEIGQIVYEIHIPHARFKDFNYAKYDDQIKDQMEKDSIHVGNLILKSKFISSEFGDSKLFFKHNDFSK